METEPQDIPADVDDVTLSLELTARAARLATRMRAEGLEGEHKTSITDVVTAADHAAEELVEGTLRRLRPEDGIIGEEGAEAPSRSGRTWVIDPVDGTYNFLSGLGTWCSALALTDGDGSLLGAVHQPAVDEAWVGGREVSTRLNGVPVEPLADLPLEEHPQRLLLPGSHLTPCMPDAGWEVGREFTAADAAAMAARALAQAAFAAQPELLEIGGILQRHGEAVHGEVHVGSFHARSAASAAIWGRM